jgi:hypothetical protein
VSNQQVAWDPVAASTSLDEAADQLARLITELKSAAQDAEHFESLAAVVRAENLAKSGDSPGMMGELRSAGQWALEVANKIGLSLVAELIKQSLFC